MRFHIDYDSGEEIRGWIVPDNPLETSRVILSINGKRVLELPASITADQFRELGWHSTGKCIFLLTTTAFPELSSVKNLELYDADTNVLVYRRVPREGLIDRRVLLIDTGIHPEVGLQNALFPYFQQSHFGIHKLSDEIVTSILGNETPTSRLIAGALVVPRYEQYFPPDRMLSAILVHDPHVEMATRMLWLKARSKVVAEDHASWRVDRYAEAALFAADYDYTDPKSLKRFFRMLPEQAYHLLYNPLSRQLGTRLPDDRLHPGNSIVAIEILARLGVVGHRTYFDAFASTLFDQIGMEGSVPLPAPVPISDEALALAERLRAVKAVADMLVFDIAMSDAVLMSFAKSWS
ncbi:hypothetical protein [Methylobacterium sp. WL8]|uniref:hypothetical protein n=1 Tax=Methylobacterium sp. WL8 TaxID=2603899 RepID=UPI0011CAB97B|nr:hypothetical protein [Methylobacterium sp. WL8]TXN78284.1 hypothetical protein FV234_22990 [Methylobacterium sp. WL8]